MAKLLAPYALCPLAERKRFVGISPDAESGCVIVTLARNIVIRYRLSNQKQVGSWSTKAMLSAPVIYDHSSKQYYGTFNGDEVASWEEHVVTLGKRSKNKFAWPIHSIVSSEDCPAVVVYKNGIISPLKADMSSSKNPPTANMDQILSENETIKDARLVSLSSVHYVAIFTMTDKELPVVHLIPVDQDRGTRASIRLERSGATLTASAILDGETPNLITLWSDGDMYTLEIPVKDNVPGKLLSKVMCIDPKQPAALLQLGQEHFTLYGAAPNSEGAYLVILSRQFGLPESMTKMKVYDSESRLWTCRNNIVLILGGYLVVAPFRLATVKLISLLGVDTTTSKANDEVDCVADNTSGGIAARINQLKENGSTEYAICELLFGEYLESGNETGLKCVLENVNDVPDKWLVQVVIFALGLNGELLLQVLRHPLTGDNTALTLVRQKLELTSAVKLMGIITQVLKDDEIDKCVLDWACLLLDAHYLQCLLSKDEQLVTTIRELHEAVQDHVSWCILYFQVDPVDPAQSIGFPQLVQQTFATQTR